MSKRLSLAKIALGCGVGGLARLANSSLLFAYNYHRIRPADGGDDSPFDDGVFGPDQKTLSRNLRYLARYTTVLSEAELIRALDQGPRGRGPYSIITFDDAYIDNYEQALPVLKQVGVPAIFFVPAMLVENRILGWWDQISYIVKNSPRTEIEFRGRKHSLKDDPSAVIRHFLTAMKQDPHEKNAGLIAELAQAADSPPPDAKAMDRELMTWDQIRRANKAGVAIGSHTNHHWVLSTLDEAGQAEEIGHSKTFLEQKLGHPVRTLSYPVGGSRHYNQTSMDLAKSAGYEAAFTYNAGVSRLDAVERFKISRLDAESDFAFFRAQMNFPKLMDYSQGREAGRQQ